MFNTDEGNLSVSILSETVLQKWIAEILLQRLHGNRKWSGKAIISLSPDFMQTPSSPLTFVPPHVDEHALISGKSEDLWSADFLTALNVAWTLHHDCWESHRRYTISAGPIWFWGCCSSGLISVRSPVCCPWRGRPSLCMSDQTGTSL